jgi:hypothetical protein
VSTWFRAYGYAEVLDDLVIGAYPLDASDVGMLSFIQIERVLNLVEDDEYRRGERSAVQSALAKAGIDEFRLELIDYGGLSPNQLEAAVRQVSGWLDEGIRSYVHCRAGWQRSAAVAAGVVAVRNNLDIDKALEFVQKRKPSADPLPHQRADLRTWWDGRARERPDEDAADQGR